MTNEMKCTCGHGLVQHVDGGGTVAVGAGKCTHRGYNPSTHEDWPCSCRAFKAALEPSGLTGPQVIAAFGTAAIAGSLATPAPIAMRIPCPECSELHIDEGEFAAKPHHTHACQSCGCVWRPAIVATVGVRFLPGFKNLKEQP